MRLDDSEQSDNIEDRRGESYGGGGGGQARRTGAPSDDIGRFVSTILGNIEVEWTDIFREAGGTYRKPVLVLYQGQTGAACGGAAQSAMGPFYCPNDEKIYLDTSFFREIETRFQGCEVGSRSCQFSQAYVIAHEVGHHVQKLSGILPKVQQQQQGMDRAQRGNMWRRASARIRSWRGIRDQRPRLLVT